MRSSEGQGDVADGQREVPWFLQPVPGEDGGDPAADVFEAVPDDRVPGSDRAVGVLESVVAEVVPVSDGPASPPSGQDGPAAGAVGHAPVPAQRRAPSTTARSGRHPVRAEGGRHAAPDAPAERPARAARTAPARLPVPAGLGLPVEEPEPRSAVRAAGGGRPRAAAPGRPGAGRRGRGPARLIRRAGAAPGASAGTRPARAPARAGEVSAGSPSAFSTVSLPSAPSRTASASASAAGATQAVVVGEAQQRLAAALDVEHDLAVDEHDERARLAARPVAASCGGQGSAAPYGLAGSVAASTSARASSRRLRWRAAEPEASQPPGTGRLPGHLLLGGPHGGERAHPVDRAGRGELRGARAPRRSSRAAPGRPPRTP